MRATTIGIVLAFVAACAGEDVADVEDGPKDDAPAADARKGVVWGIAEGSPDAIGVLRVANELSQVDLHARVGMTTTSARNIASYRAGVDGTPGTADDRTFATLHELDLVPYVGKSTFAHLLAFARANGYVPSPDGAIRTVFLIVMENQSWSAIHGSSDAPYVNGTLLPMASYADAYYNPPASHPSEPNYLWLEGGTNFGVTSDADPATNHVASHAHLAKLLDDANIPWRTYQEDIAGTDCPLVSHGDYAAKHDPFVFFDDLTGGGSAADAGCIAHNRPLPELAADLAAGTVARYNFITPNLCDDMHDSCAPTHNKKKQGDDFLAAWVPKILASRAWQDGGVLFITWDEAGLFGGDGPIGMIVLSPLAKGNGYHNQIRYSHSSTLRTLEEIFGVSPMLGDAAHATDLADLFSTFP